MAASIGELSALRLAILKAGNCPGVTENTSISVATLGIVIPATTSWGPGFYLTLSGTQFTRTPGRCLETSSGSWSLELAPGCL